MRAVQLIASCICVKINYSPNIASEEIGQRGNSELERDLESISVAFYRGNCFQMLCRDNSQHSNFKLSGNSLVICAVSSCRLTL